MRHRTFCVVLNRLLETLYCLDMVETEEPVEPSVEPELSLGGGRRYLAAVRSEIKIDHSLSPHLSRIRWTCFFISGQLQPNE
jgi:hypothetical protein